MLSQTPKITTYFIMKERKFTILCLFFFHLQRDLDFTIEVDFKGELSEMKETMQYKMR